ncbi:hypothetical protein A0H76_3039, partial [Hepatospora eriocheir]
MIFDLIAIVLIIRRTLALTALYTDADTRSICSINLSDPSIREAMVYKDLNGAIRIAERDVPGGEWGQFEVLTGNPVHKKLRLVKTNEENYRIEPHVNMANPQMNSNTYKYGKPIVSHKEVEKIARKFHGDASPNPYSNIKQSHERIIRHEGEVPMTPGGITATNNAPIMTNTGNNSLANTNNVMGVDMTT